MPHVYLVQPVILIGTNRYKIGMSSKDDLNRVKSYGLGTRYLCILDKPNASDIEKRLIEAFNQRYQLIGGHEYFQVDNEQEMISLFISIAMSVTSQTTDIDDQLNDLRITKVPSQTTDIDDQLNDLRITKVPSQTMKQKPITKVPRVKAANHNHMYNRIAIIMSEYCTITYECDRGQLIQNTIKLWDDEWNRMSNQIYGLLLNTAKYTLNVLKATRILGYKGYDYKGGYKCIVNQTLEYMQTHLESYIFNKHHKMISIDESDVIDLFEYVQDNQLFNKIQDCSDAWILKMREYIKDEYNQVYFDGQAFIETIYGDISMSEFLEHMLSNRATDHHSKKWISTAIDYISARFNWGCLEPMAIYNTLNIDELIANESTYVGITNKQAIVILNMVSEIVSKYT